MTLRPSLARSLLFLCLIATLGAAAWRAFELAYADFLVSQNTLDAVSRAVALDPENADTQLWLAEHRQYAGLDPSTAILVAEQLRPLDSKPRIRLALVNESAGRYPEAERLLLEAAAADRLYEPAWTLANFYFRRGNRESFWTWADRALAMSYGDRKPLFELCRRMSASPSEFAARIARHTALGPILTGYLLDSVDAAIERHDAALARETWRALVERGLIREDSVMGRGFGWRIPAVAGVRNDALRFTLTGQQPEHCELLWRWLPFDIGAREVKAVIEPQVAGLRWILDAPSGLARVALAYERPQGSMRFAGEFTVKAVRVE
ncbi:MAG: hypothetical protein U0Q16_19215 [Bryobacteraceae bacterium]